MTECFIFSMNHFARDYGLLLELHTLTQAARSYALMLKFMFNLPIQHSAKVEILQIPLLDFHGVT